MVKVQRCQEPTVIVEQHKKKDNVKYNALKIVDQNSLVEIPLTAQEDVIPVSASPI